MAEKLNVEQVTRHREGAPILLSRFTNDDGWQFTDISELEFRFTNDASVAILDGIYGTVLEGQDDPSVTYQVGDPNDLLVRNFRGELSIILQSKADRILQ